MMDDPKAESVVFNKLKRAGVEQCLVVDFGLQFSNELIFAVPLKDSGAVAKVLVNTLPAFVDYSIHELEKFCSTNSIEVPQGFQVVMAECGVPWQKL